MLQIEDDLGIKSCDECLRKRECSMKRFDDRFRGCDKYFCKTEADIDRVRMEIWRIKKTSNTNEWQNKWEDW